VLSQNSVSRASPWSTTSARKTWFCILFML